MVNADQKTTNNETVATRSFSFRFYHVVRQKY